jgi:hypothetical protein
MHAGTTDVDVQVDLEIACGTVNGRMLEKALRNAEFQPESGRLWRWAANDGGDTSMVVKFELLADQSDAMSGDILVFDECDELGAVNLRGTGFASRDVTTRQLTARVGDLRRTVEVNVAGLAGFLMAKAAAARERRKPKDWYDMTSRSSFCTMTPAVPRRRPERFSSSSVMSWWEHPGPRWMI